MSLNSRLELIGWYWGGAVLGWVSAAAYQFHQFSLAPRRLAEVNYKSHTGIGRAPFTLAFGILGFVLALAHLRLRTPPWPFVALLPAAILGYLIPTAVAMSRSRRFDLLLANPLYNFDRLTFSLAFGVAGATLCCLLFSRVTVAK